MLLMNFTNLGITMKKSKYSKATTHSNTNVGRILGNHAPHKLSV